MRLGRKEEPPLPAGSEAEAESSASIASTPFEAEDEEDELGRLEGLRPLALPLALAAAPTVAEPWAPFAEPAFWVGSLMISRQ